MHGSTSNHIILDHNLIASGHNKIHFLMYDQERLNMRER